MPQFGIKSKQMRGSCHPDLQRVLDEAIKHFDFSVVWGHRDELSQNRAYNEGHSNLRWPNSNHNKLPSRAFDVVPYPGSYDAGDRAFYEMATHILSASLKHRVRIRWGGHWTNPKDMAHFELMD